MFDFLDRIETQARAKDPSPPLDIFDGPLGSGRKIRTDGGPGPALPPSNVSPVPEFRFTEIKDRSEYAPPSHNAEYLDFKRQLEDRRTQRDLGNEINELDKQLRGMQSSMPDREMAAAKLERGDFSKFHAAPERSSVVRETVRTAVRDAKTVIAEARAEGATDDEILAEAGSISPTCRRLYAALI